LKKRVDIWLVELGHAASREKARRAVLAGQVFCGTGRIVKASQNLDAVAAARLLIRQKDPAVSRAYYKLAHALRVFSLSVQGLVCLDVGSSTGGFTQKLLEAGAQTVYAVDCGTNQLDFRLRRDPRVVVMEKTNARYLTPDMFPLRPTLAVMDVSFISSTLLIPVLGEVHDIAECVILIKPQFEAGKEQMGKGGVIRDPDLWRGVLAAVIKENAASCFQCLGLAVSPVIGTKGNIEFLGFFRKNGAAKYDVDLAMKEAVSLAAGQGATLTPGMLP